jgi:PKD repeat protein
MYPPCATLNPPPPTSGVSASSITFNWQTDCSHLSINSECVDLNHIPYTFTFRVRDDFCPLPAETVVIITIVVEGDSLEDAPSLRCVSVLPNGDAELTWVPTVSNFGTFDSYQIFHSSAPNADFTRIDSIADINATSYTHVGANADNAEQYYYIRTRSGCGGEIYGIPTNTFATILPFNADPTDDVANLEWNALSTPLPNTTLSGYYRIYRMLEGGNWTLIDSTQSLTYQDDVSVCNDSAFYRVEIEDNSGCVSVSAIAGGDFLTDVTAGFTASASGFVTYGFVNISENALFYSWDFGDGSSSQNMNTTHTFGDTGSYIVTLIAWNSCDTDTFIMPLTVTGIHEAEGISAFEIFPNPASTTLTIQSSTTHPQTLKIVNTLGQVVFSSTFDVQHSTFDISNLNTGLYHLLLEDKQGRVQGKKFVVAR